MDAVGIDSLRECPLAPARGTRRFAHFVSGGPIDAVGIN